MTTPADCLATSFVACLVLLICTVLTNPAGAESLVGVCYGTLGDNLPPPAEAIQLIKSVGMSKVRLYAPDEGVQNALRNTDIEVTIGVPNDILRRMATDQAFAEDWVRYNVLRFTDVKFRYIAVGNEVFRGELTQYVGPAMQNVYNTLRNAGVQDRIKVSTAVDMAVIGKSYPPSSGEFLQEAMPFIVPVVRHLQSFGSPLLINVYPYFSYIYNRASIQASYALFTAGYDVVTDPNSQLKYRNLFDAMVDSVYFALERIGAGNMDLVISESGWPSAGGLGDVTTVDNARTFNNNLARHVTQGTPKGPGRSLETYIFAIFNENKKTGEETEKNFGLFYPSKQPVYPFSLS